MFTKKTIKDIDLSNKTVLLRADYNVPLEDGEITDDYRIKQSLPTIKYLLDKNVRLIICSHLGRPDGKVNEKYSLKPISARLSKLLDGVTVKFASDCIGEAAINEANSLKPKEILLLENLRFHPEEEANDDGFAKQLADLCEVYVDDAFGVVHRAHASVAAITKYQPSVAGLLLEKEVDTITSVMGDPDRPLAAIVGGAKVADKIEILKRFIKHANFLAIGGALAHPFFVAKGHKIGDSLYQKEELIVAKEVLAEAEIEAKKRHFNFFVPLDVVVANKIDKKSPTRIVDFASNSVMDIVYYPKRVPADTNIVQADEMILDIGPFSASFIAGSLQQSATVVWNGTMGVTETAGLQGPIGPYSHGTETIIEAIRGDFGHKPFSLVGGGDTVGYIEERQILSGFNHVSTGGGASLELMSGHKLPGVEALLDKK